MSTIRISKASKMPCRSWSLQALDTCPASKNADGSLVDACQGCYATDGNYRFSNVKAPRIHNKEDWKRDEWVADMVKELDNDRYFRWFDSGDMYDLRLAHKILEVMQSTPWVRHWLPTRMHKFEKFGGVVEAMQSLPNVVVRLSSDSVRGDTVGNAKWSSTIIGTDQVHTTSFTVCRSYEQEGKCLDCRACWSKDVPVIAYVQHGRKMAKVNKNIIAIG